MNTLRDLLDKLSKPAQLNYIDVIMIHLSIVVLWLLQMAH